MKALLIAEKPSLMRSIQAVYNKHKAEIPFEIDFLSQAGHLIALKMPSEIDEEKYKRWKMENFPINVPYIYHVSKGKNELISKIRTAIKGGNYDFIINAGDPDQEGQLLIDETLNYIGNKVSVKRFWSNDLTEEAVLNALLNLKNNEDYINIYNSALVRQHADYQFGMNITGVSTLKFGEIYKVGRVKAAIIRILVDRELAIRNFVEKTTYKRAFTYQNKAEFIDETIYDEKDKALQALPKTNSATVVDVKETISNTKAPKLFKLSTLQQEAHKQLGFNGAKTLAVLQNLYEAKVTSYPRTDCEYISSKEDLTGLLRKIAFPNTDDYISKVAQIKNDATYCNDKAISTEGHTAILPTGKNPKGLGEDEQKLYNLILRRFIAIFCDPKKTKNITIKAYADNDKSQGEYIFKESIDLDMGYDKVLNPGAKPRQSCGITFTKGMELTPIKFDIKECVSKPPARYNDGSIIKVLDKPEEYIGNDDKKVSYSIGTPATRSTIIEECKKCGYFTVQKGAFYATPKAEKIIKELGDIPLFSITNSGRWENMLDDIRKGKENAENVEQTLLNECHNIVYDIKNRNIEKDKSISSASGGKSSASGNSLESCNCPACGASIASGQYGAYCSGKCGMVISKFMGKQLSNPQVVSLLSGKKVLLKGLPKKNGETYDAYIKMVGVKEFSYQKNGQTVTGKGYDVEMSFPKTTSVKKKKKSFDDLELG